MAKKKSKKEKPMTMTEMLKAKLPVNKVLGFAGGALATVFGLAGLKKVAEPLITDADEKKVQRAAGVGATILGGVGVVYGKGAVADAGLGMAGGGLLTVADSYAGEKAEELVDKVDNLLPSGNDDDDATLTQKDLNLLIASNALNSGNDATPEEVIYV